jgi:hypothetical protein
MTTKEQRMIDAANDVAAEIKSLANQIKDQGLPPEVEDSVLAGFQATAARLEGIGNEEVPEQEVPGAESEET